MPKTLTIIAVTALSTLFILACFNITGSNSESEPVVDSGITLSDAINSLRANATDDSTEYTPPVCDPDVVQRGARLEDRDAARVVAQAVLMAVDADIAVQNQGGFQTNLFAGESPWSEQQITTDNLHCVVFPNEIIVLEMTGQAFLNFLEYFRTERPDTNLAEEEARPIVAYSPGLEDDDTLRANLGRTYRIAFNDFLTGRLYRSGALDGTSAYWQWEVYERLGYFIPAAHDRQSE